LIFDTDTSEDVTVSLLSTDGSTGAGNHAQIRTTGADGSGTLEDDANLTINNERQEYQIELRYTVPASPDNIKVFNLHLEYELAG